MTDDTFGKDDEAVGAAGASWDLAGVCEILMFDRGRGLTASSLSRTAELDMEDIDVKSIK